MGRSATRPWFWIWAAATVAIPMMAFMGVRISWLMREGSRAWRWLACCALSARSERLPRLHLIRAIRTGRRTGWCPGFPFTGYR